MRAGALMALAVLGGCVTINHLPPSAAVPQKPDTETAGLEPFLEFRGPQGSVMIYWADPADSLFPPRAALQLDAVALEVGVRWDSVKVAGISAGAGMVRHEQHGLVVSTVAVFMEYASGRASAGWAYGVSNGRDRARKHAWFFGVSVGVAKLFDLVRAIPTAMSKMR